MANATFVARVVAGSLGALALIGSASAADFPIKAKPMIAPSVYNWTGIYGGLYAGYGGGMKDWGGINFNAHGGLVGGQIGFNQQVGNFVFGIELDGGWSGMKGSQFETIAIPFSVSNFDASIATKIDATITGALRMGFAADRWLVYIKAGAGWMREHHSQFQRSTITGIAGAQTVNIAGSENRFGPMLGFGAEYAFLGNWSAKVEYNYFDFYANGIVRETGTLTSFAGTTSNVVTTVNIRERMHLAKVGLNYRFGPEAAPEIAPTPAAPGFNWTGVYVGAQAAGGWGTTRWVGFSPFDGYDVTGGLAGVTAGVNAQAGVFVAGLELEWLGGRISGNRSDITSVTVSGTSTQFLESRIDSIAMATMRAGFVAADRWLVYGKGGFALAHETHTNNFSFAGNAGITSSFFRNQGDALHTAYVVGAGTEYAFLGNWAAKLEYNYLSFRAQDVFLPGTITEISPVLGTGTTSLPNAGTVRQGLHLLKAGLNYHFNPMENVVRARY
jgi:outer membrane immunogenic protein